MWIAAEQINRFFSKFFCTKSAEVYQTYLIVISEIMVYQGIWQLCVDNIFLKIFVAVVWEQIPSIVEVEKHERQRFIDKLSNLSFKFYFMIDCLMRKSRV